MNKPLNVSQAAEYLGLTKGYIYNLVHFGKLTAYKPSGKRLFFKQEDLEKFAFRNPCGDVSETADKILNKK